MKYLIYIAGDVFLAICCAHMLLNLDTETERLYKLEYKDKLPASEETVIKGKIKVGLKILYGSGLLLTGIFAAVYIWIVGRGVDTSP